MLSLFFFFFFCFACAIHEHPHTVMAGAGVRARLHREIKDSGKRSRKTCHALRFSLSSLSLDYTLCLLCSFCACAPAMFRNLIWGGVLPTCRLAEIVCHWAGIHIQYGALSISVRSDGKMETGRERLEKKKPAVEKLRHKD